MTSSTWSLYAKSLFALTIRLQVFSVFSRDRLPALLEGEDFFGGNSHLQGYQGSHMLFKPASSLDTKKRFTQEGVSGALSLVSILKS